MTYTGAADAKDSREALGKALAALQEDPNLPKDVLAVAQNIAKAVGALFEAERASSEVDGKSAIKNALGSLSQTLALLQDVQAQHPGIGVATETIAKSMSQLYPLTTRTTRPPGEVGAGGSQVPAPGKLPDTSLAGPAAAPSSVGGPSGGASGGASGDGTAGPPTAPGKIMPQTRAGATWDGQGAPQSAAPAQPLTRDSLPSVSDADRRHTEANIGATTESNFFVGFSGEISEGGVFLATYDTLPVGTRVEVLITLPGGFEFQAPGFVKFVRDPMDFTADSEPGMGIAFEALPTKSRDLVLRFIRKRPPMFYDV